MSNYKEEKTPFWIIYLAIIAFAISIYLIPFIMIGVIIVLCKNNIQQIAMIKKEKLKYYHNNERVVLLFTMILIGSLMVLFCFPKLVEAISNSIEQYNLYFGEFKNNYSSAIYDEVKARIYLIPAIIGSGVEIGILSILISIKKFLKQSFDYNLNNES